MSLKRRTRRNAFTLIELLVVIAIIALLVSILVPSLQTARKLAQRAMCMTHYKNFGLAAQMYMNDNTDWVPPSSVTPNDGTGSRQWDDILLRYVEGGLIVPDNYNGSWFHVGTRRITPNGLCTDPSGKVFTYSKMMTCPSQPWSYDYSLLGTPPGVPSPFYHYVMYRSWLLSQEPAPDMTWKATTLNYAPGADPKAGMRVNEYRNVSQFAFFGEPQVYNTNGGCASPRWQTLAGSRSVIVDMAAKAVHTGRTNVFCTLSGNTFLMTDQEMLAQDQVKTKKLLPFYDQ